MSAAAVLAAQTVLMAPTAMSASTTFTNNTPTAILDGFADPYPSSLEVSGLDAAVYDVDLTLHGLSHTWPEDIEVVLEGPGGLAATVMSDLGDDTDLVDATLVFDDDAAMVAPVPLTSGRYLPEDFDPDPADPDIEPPAEDTFADLVSSPTQLNGTWRLWVEDDGMDDSGTLASWSLTFHRAEPPRVLSPTDGSITRGSTVAVHGTGTPNTSVSVALAGRPAHTLTVAGDGTWSTEFTGVADGLHFVSAWVTALGPSGATSVRTTVDNGPPTGTLTLLTVRGTAERTSSRRVYLAVQSSEPLKGVRVSNDGEPYGQLITQQVNGGYPWLLGDHDGSRRVLVQLEDRAGNVSTGYISDTVTLDRVSPRVIRTWPRNNARGVSRTVVIRARFDDFVTPNPMVRLTQLARVQRVGAKRSVPAVVRYDASTATVRILPTVRLRQDTRYRVRVSGFQDDAGNFNDQDSTKLGSQQIVLRFRTR